MLEKSSPHTGVRTPQLWLWLIVNWEIGQLGSASRKAQQTRSRRVALNAKRKADKGEKYTLDGLAESGLMIRESPMKGRTDKEAKEGALLWKIEISYRCHTP